MKIFYFLILIRTNLWKLLKQCFLSKYLTGLPWLNKVTSLFIVIRNACIGDPGDNFYVISKGIFEVYVTNKNVTQLVAELGPGKSFGELALMYNSPRSATVKAKQESLVYAVDRFTFKNIIYKTTSDKLREYEHFLSKVDLFST